jgi:hypothetical protein
MTNAAGLFGLQMNFIEFQLHYLLLRLHCNVSFCVAAKEILKIHKTADLIKKALLMFFIFIALLFMFVCPTNTCNSFYMKIAPK